MDGSAVVCILGDQYDSTQLVLCKGEEPKCLFLIFLPFVRFHRRGFCCCSQHSTVTIVMMSICHFHCYLIPTSNIRFKLLFLRSLCFFSWSRSCGCKGSRVFDRVYLFILLMFIFLWSCKCFWEGERERGGEEGWGWGWRFYILQFAGGSNVC